ncbi:hypothetical protein [Azohydromonas sediminis]|uniref:hypothetical protein n=1 Tax=Azohydromonas sediminis TaxID=2259674 RepID=UPI001B357999|nr:hypothetical protein [Azohydromonas sediminis]
MHAREVEAPVVTQGNVVGPELVVERGAGVAQALAHQVHRHAAAPPVGGQAHHPHDAVLDDGAGGHLHAALLDERVGTRRELVRELPAVFRLPGADG